MKDLISIFSKGILTLKLNNPENRNAITKDMIDSLELELKRAEYDDSVQVIILTGEGKSFCAGGDLKSMVSKSGMFAGGPNKLRENYSAFIQRIPRAMEMCSKPIIAMVNGAAIGAGCDLACMCDIRIGCEYSKFGETFTSLGLVPGDGGTFFLQRVVGYSKAMEMFLTSDILEASEARQAGLLNHLVDSSEMLNLTIKMAEKIKQNAPIALSLTKKAMKFSYQHSLEESLNLLAAYQGITQNSEDHLKALKSKQDKSQAEFLRI